MARDSSRHRRAQRYRNGILYRTCRVSGATLAVPRRSLVFTRVLPLVSDGSATPRPAFAIEAANNLATPGGAMFRQVTSTIWSGSELTPQCPFRKIHDDRTGDSGGPPFLFPPFRPRVGRLEGKRTRPNKTPRVTPA